MFLPFYVPGREALRIVIVGGGYSGLSALVTIREYRPDAEIVLVDPRPYHLKITHLHESFRRPLADFKVPFATLAKRFNFHHITAELKFDDAELKQWQSDRVITVGQDQIGFDYLLIATGAGFKKLAKSSRIIDLDEFIEKSGPDLLEENLAATGASDPWITAVGGGATGIQYLFEIANFVRERRIPCRLRLVDSEHGVLTQFDAKLGQYVQARMADLGIEHVPGSFFRTQEADHVVLEATETGELSELDSHLTLLFVGKSASVRLHANFFGQVTVDGEALDRVFTAGDCSYYRSLGSNAMTAQSAVRKGKLVARNILRHSGLVKLLEPYLHRDLGYVISMGPQDSVGWVALERNVVGGFPATVVKEIVEAQYDLLLAGIDTYVL
ncbi:NAD(P)/FAD-dependent oxidoreductase [Methylocaldum sp.]|uniref:NAD(P)/FAD-dependent oxidoreductase n=1 Tax=Methylocaldum sp. TaxID=1969727 RepID=UPI002D2A3A52|nr:FAD-dependent oxidoreductase [Methylocaldum sp.]HYE34025.1 FAD-dependent oxidoreductase [Methylocaldum sp.]